jgi:hypothetical protein
VGTLTTRASLHELAARVGALEATVAESRQLHQRLCDLLEVVTEVLVPATDAATEPGDARLDRALDRLSRTLADDPAADDPAAGDQRSL